MTPIKWNGSTWVNTNEDDTGWYDYENKIWANAQTEDGSFWVWIPRYAYQIASGYHTGTAGNVNVKFLIDKTNNTIDETTIDATPSYSGDSQTNYIVHPAFTFGSTEISGFWAAKFEASIDNDVIKSIPNVESRGFITPGNAFEFSFNMRNNSIYGWHEDNRVDTHLMKNSEWGAVAYMSLSVYGIGSTKIWMNPSSDFITGCAGNVETPASIAGCPYTYETENGVKASSTGTVFGIYDLRGARHTRVAAYINNANSNLATHGQQILDADAKYKDVYNIGGSDNQELNYEANSQRFGDALYETSETGGDVYNSSWFNEISRFPYTNDPWLIRGGNCFDGLNTGLTYFSNTQGNAWSSLGFRPVLIVDDNI